MSLLVDWFQILTCRRRSWRENVAMLLLAWASWALERGHPARPFLDDAATAIDPEGP